MRLSLLIISLLCASTLTAQWESVLPTVGTFSSMRVADLTGDGIKDVVIGAGREEFQKCDSAIVAIDGYNGDILWTVSAVDQMFGSAIFQDINNDGVDDIFIGGRSAELFCISGKNGEVIWRFTDIIQTDPVDHPWYNFYNPQWIPDQSGDGQRDILISNGGDVMALPEDKNRPPGYLVIIDANSGRIIAETVTPDRQEIYMSPTVLDMPESDDQWILFGTGGETVGGGLYVDKLSNLRKGNLDDARLLHRSDNKGYIGPPSCVDLNKDGVLDIVTNAVAGIVMAIDGASFDVMWTVEIPNTESYSSPAIGFFNSDDVPDVFVSFGQGVWPKLDWSIQHMINGKTGAIEYIDSLGFYQNSSPLAIDLNQDGRDEIIMSINVQEVDSLYRKYFFTTLAALEFVSRDVVFLNELTPGSNLSSTPWIGDLDDNGFLDIIYCHGINPRQTYTFDGISIKRLDTQVEVPKGLFWGAYQGSNYDGKMN